MLLSNISFLQGQRQPCGRGEHFHFNVSFIVPWCIWQSVGTCINREVRKCCYSVIQALLVRRVLLIVVLDGFVQFKYFFFYSIIWSIKCTIVAYAAEHERMVEAYSAINQKLEQSLSEQSLLEKTIQELKVWILIIVICP